ncbi:uncharacterized protein N7529_008324 [Penicillium soppii]|uniref:uncharacterized protein n=1 Tax=Penicillium soppii TaxID=69789 RepID=UPI0025494F34|nr:uncharacterized protein N7529_008324 [Penicillium soppii]KAJ5861014.1 hypothetical protein N7529_008324 [Penicillium soppii]
MATRSAIQRSAVTLSSAARTPARTATSSTAAFHRSISAPTRGLVSIPNTHPANRLKPSHTLRPAYLITKNPHQQTRQNTNGTKGSLREWGFEEINAALPSATPSPTHTPVILIDVREPAELTGTGIIPSAVSIPLASQPDALYLTADEFETRFGFPKPELVEGAQMVFYCKAGVRAWAAAQMAVQAGYDPARIGVYDGSWLDWERNGGKVEKWDGDDY